jgi:hypothetical protein
VVNSRHLFPVIMRHARTLSFQPFAQLAARLWCDASDSFVDMHNECHPWNRDLFRDTRTALAPGPHLDYQNLKTGESMQRIIDSLDAELASAGKGDFSIYKWITHVFSVAPSDGIYGKNNHFEILKSRRTFGKQSTLFQIRIARLTRVPLGYGFRLQRS